MFIVFTIAVLIGFAFGGIVGGAAAAVIMFVALVVAGEG